MARWPSLSPRSLITLMLLPAFTGCSWFNDLGEHLPVIGDRCENWQCFTESGREQSELDKQARQKEESDKAAASSTPATDTAPQTGKAAPAGATPPAATPAATPAQTPPASHVQYIDPDKVAPIETTPSSW